MQPDLRDASYIWDMLDNARTADEIIKGMDLQQYLADRKVQLAVERLVEIIGEAARRISEEFRQAHPEIAWRGIIA